MIVRPVEPHEYEAVGDMTVEAYRTLDAAMPASLERFLRDVEARARDCTVLVADLGAGPAGTVTYVPGPHVPSAEFTEPDACGMRALAVAPPARRRGAAAALVAAVIDLGRREGRAEVILHTRVAMPAARALYEQLGFTRDPGLDWQPHPDIELLGYRFRL